MERIFVLFLIFQQLIKSIISRSQFLQPERCREGHDQVITDAQCFWVKNPIISKISQSIVFVPLYRFPQFQLRLFPWIIFN
jgi:hypothetical protein